MATRTIIKENVELYSPKIFRDNELHIYDVECHNGYAICRRCEEEDKKFPYYLYMKYPKRSEIVSDMNKAQEVLEYNGLFDLTVKDINYGDIMMCYGVVERAKGKVVPAILK